MLSANTLTFSRAMRAGILLVLAQLCACTPIGDYAKQGPAPTGNGGRTAEPTTDGGTQIMSIMSDRVVQPKAACTTPEERACSADKDKNVVLVCRDGNWTTDVSCNDGEGCVADAQGRGHCQPVISDCVAREPGDLYCDADAKRRVCLSASMSRASDCNDLERCVVIAGKAQCRCVPGAVLRDSVCENATSCSDGNGGCDQLTMCMTGPNGRFCTDCPPGYVGDGLTGCAPLLLALQPSCGLLDPPFAGDHYDYRLQIALACPSLQFDATPPMGSTVTPNGAELPATTWSLSPVKLGETKMPIVVASQYGVPSKYSVTVQRTGVQEAYIKASNADAEDRLGFGMVVVASEIFAGAPWEDSNSVSDPANNDAANSGALYSFVKKATGWEQQLYLKASPVVAGEYFGTSVGVSGDMMVVGAPGLDLLTWYGGTPVAVRQGAVYAFTRHNGTWVQEARLTPTEGMTGDMFGARLALVGDTLFVGSPGDSGSGLPKSGAAYVYKREAGAWVEKQRLLPPGSLNNGGFGLAVSIGSDRLLVGAPNDSGDATNAGAAFVFTQGAAGWQMEQRLQVRSPATNATFGWQVKQRGELLMVSAPAVTQMGPAGKLYFFEHDGATWAQTESLGAAYPTAADLYGGAFAYTDRMLVVGANGDSSGSKGIDADASRTDAYQSGAIYLYAKSDANTWVPSTYIKASNPDSSDYFAVNVATGDVGDDAIYVDAPDECGGSRKINGDADNNSAKQSGAIYVFR